MITIGTIMLGYSIVGYKYPGRDSSNTSANSDSFAKDKVVSVLVTYAILEKFRFKRELRGNTL